MNEIWEQNKPIILKELALVIFTLWVASAMYCYFAGMPLSQSFPWVGFQSFVDPYITEGQMFIIWCLAGATFMVINGIMFIDLRGNEARFANAGDLRKAGYTSGKGVVLGKKGNKFLWSNDKGHLLCSAMTHSGKGVGLVIPNMLNWAQSALVLDMKGEIYRITAGFRQAMGHRVINFAPYAKDGKTACFNPFDFIAFDTDSEISQISRIANYAFPITGNPDHDFWPENSSYLFEGMVLYLHYNPKRQVSFGELHRFMHEDDNFERHLRAIVKNDPDLPEKIRAPFITHIERAEKEQSGTRNMVSAFLKKWSDQKLDHAMSSSSFSFKELRERPTTLYLNIPFVDSESLRPVVALLLLNAMDDLANEEFNEEHEEKVLFLLDEFTSIGKLKIMDRITDLAGYGIRLFCIIQNLGQLNLVYGSDMSRVIQSNFKVKVFFGIDDHETSNVVSKHMGEKTVRKRTKSYKSGSGAIDAPTINESRERVPLMTPSEITLMPDKNMLILKTGQRPVRCKKIVYYKDKNLKDKANLPIKAS